ncbi:uncharacterized protein N7498_008079 [Penicillium cinerascens]|uniref:Uncharacterized protein n=1 Tax=Penicillium cinerascens TaxID=70096 RepID=A0A9W9JHW0_9EURO|nr:uncharacterized protein N7498_008079 [Penicillium cinerascens]KAJ5194641.1 hypothetical protein N7498_008079 [Penicillium cinerascens]
MEVKPPPTCPPMSPSDYPEIPTRTPRATIEKMRALCIDGNLLEFREVFDLLRPHPVSQDFEIREFYEVMVEAIKRENVWRNLIGQGNVAMRDKASSMRRREMVLRSSRAIMDGIVHIDRDHHV